jgi:Domain of unknown function (DUF4296)
MIRFTFLILIAFSLTLASCRSRRSRIDSTNLIPEKELVSILTDIYITDGLVGLPRIAMKYSPLDSISTYNYIIEKHGYTRETLDKTLKYYFIKNPKKLIKIYDKVLGILSEMESRVQKELTKTNEHPGSVWPGSGSYFFPDPSGSDSTHFDINLTRPGVYTLTSTVTLFPDDQSLNPRLTGFTCNPDSIDTGKRNYISMPVRYIKDGNPHKYSFAFKVPVKSKLHLRGNLFDYDNNPDNWGRHLIIRDISVIYSLVEK